NDAPGCNRPRRRFSGRGHPVAADVFVPAWLERTRSGRVSGCPVFLRAGDVSRRFRPRAAGDPSRSYDCVALRVRREPGRACVARVLVRVAQAWWQNLRYYEEVYLALSSNG